MSKTTFRTLLIVNWALALAAYVGRWMDVASVPAGVLDAVNAVNVSGMPIGLGLYYLLVYVYFLLFLVSTVGLFAFKNFARPLYLAYLALGFVLASAVPLTVMGRAYYLTGGLFSLSSLLLLTLIFFSPVRAFFGRGRAGELN